jgi:hypothetical protein
MRDNTVAHRGGTPSDLDFAPAGMCATAAGMCATAGDPNSMSASLARRVARLGDEALLRDLARLITQDRMTTAEILAHIAEVDVRRLYAPAGYPSMHAYCVGELRLSEDAASRRIQAARAARRVPALFGALAEGRLHLTAVCLLAPHVTERNAEELIEAAAHRGKAEIEAMLLRRSWRGGWPEYALAHVDVRGTALGDGGDGPARDVPNDNFEVVEHALAHVADPGAEVATHSPERVSLHVSISRTTQEKLRYAQALLSHVVPSGDPAEVLDRALDALIGQIERRRFGAGAGGSRRHRATGRAERRDTLAERRAAQAERQEAPAERRGARGERSSARDRYIPARVRRAVWERDHGRCTFVGTNGHRCESRRFLEFDHVEPVARAGGAPAGGSAAAEGVRLRCRTHNQLEAERVFGAGFMINRRQEALRARVELRERTRSREQDRAQVEEQSRDIQACLRRLGCRADEAKRAAEHAAALHGATLEESLRAALRSIAPKSSSFRAPERAVDA